MTQKFCYVVFVIIYLGLTTHAIAQRDQTDQVKTLRVAVATNFAPVFKEIVNAFTTVTQIELSVITGSTGKLYAQIKHGMEVDLFLSADQSRINRLVSDGLALNDTQSTYAEGRLVWWQPGSQPSFDTENTLDIGEGVSVVAFAQPDLAPYGIAAEQALMNCFRFDASRLRFVHGENVGQTFAHVATGNAEAGLVALSNIRLAENITEHSYAVVPKRCHEPIKQDAIVLSTSPNKYIARQFLEFLVDERNQHLMLKYGYSLP